MFLVKKRRMPVCEFTIDKHHIARKTKDGRLLVAWSDIVAIHVYSQGYLVEKNNGAMPLPFRCLSPEEASALRILVERRQAELRAAT